MPTQTIRFAAPAALTLMARLYPVGSGTAFAAEASCSEAARGGVYTFTQSGSAGQYEVHVRDTTGGLNYKLGIVFVETTDTEATFDCVAELHQLDLTTDAATASDQASAANTIVSSGTHGNAALRTLLLDVPTNAELGTALTGMSTLTQADIRSAVGLASANLDTQLQTIDDYVDNELALVKVVTDRLGGMLVLDGSVYKFTANALEEAPAGGGGGGGGEVTGFSASAIAQLGGVSISLTDNIQTDTTPLDIVQGCDYDTADGTAKTWTLSDTADLSAATATLRLKRGSTASDFDGTVTESATDTWSIEVELTAAQTAALTVGNDWTYSLVLTLANGHKRVVRLPGHRARVLAR